VLRTVGIDIGSTTSHAMFARLRLQRLADSLSSRYVVVEREVLHRSPIVLTPYSAGNNIDAAALEAHIAGWYSSAGLAREDVDTGAVILTGAALEQDNARELADLFAGEGGKFVCATAGHALEATLAQLRQLPGVNSATVVSPSPMDASWNLMLFNAEGAPAPEPRGMYAAYSRLSVPGYFQSVGQPLLRGRDFLESDGPDAPLVCIISQSIAHRFWPNESPVGKRIRWGRIDGNRPWFIIVGVVGDMKAIADPRDGEVLGMIARPMAQMLVHATAPLDDITFVLQARGRPISESTIRETLARADGRLTSYNLLSLADEVIE